MEAGVQDEQGSGKPVIFQAEHSTTDANEDDNEELVQFRQKWREEIGSKHSSTEGLKKETKEERDAQTSINTKAKELYLKGVTAERAGDSYMAMMLYREATKLAPDIEWQYDFSNSTSQPEDTRTDMPASEEVTDNSCREDILQMLGNLSLRRLCEPQIATKRTHMSALTPDVMLHILCWIVSSDIHLHCLEQFSLVCKGFYLLARDPIIWQKACRRLWKDVDPDKYGGSWRLLFLKTPHVHFHGCYISKTSYIRPGENSLDNFYKPFHLVTYYRFLRFFPDGSVLYLTSPEEPATCVGKLIHKQKSSSIVLSGQYRVVGNKVTAGLVSYRFLPVGSGAHRKNRKLEISHEQKFQMEFMLNGTKWHQLVWIRYQATQLHRSTGMVTETNFDIDNKMTPLYFSPVKSYFTSNSIHPL